MRTSGVILQFFDRTAFPPPHHFRESAAQAEREELLAYMREDAQRQSQKTPPSRRFSAASEEVVSVLNNLFRGKCAFCESRAPLHAHLFRPSDEAEPLARSTFSHLYYVWLRTDWGNVYGACSACAGSAKRQFPVVDLQRGALPTIEQLEHFLNENYGLWRWPHQDKRILLDPCQDSSFYRHLSFNLDGGIQAFTVAGAQTISVFNLDRSSLLEARARCFEGYLELLKNELKRGIQPNGLDFPKLEFGGGWYLLLRRVLGIVGHRLEQRYKVKPDQIGGVIHKVWAMPLGRHALELAFDEVRGPVERATVGRPAAKGEVRRLISIEVTDFKTLEKLEVNIPPAISADESVGREAEAAALLVLGENAAGKSSILEAVALALSEEKIRQSINRSPESFILDPELMGGGGREKSDNASVKLRFMDGEELELVIGDRFVEHGVMENLPPVFAYGAFRQYAPNSPLKPPKGHVTTLFRSEALLANPEAWMLELEDDQFAMVIRALQKIFLVEGDFDVVKKDNPNNRCLIVTRIGDGDGYHEVSTPLKAVSSGFRSVLAMVCDVLAGLLKLQKNTERKSFSEIEAVILIDEVEAHLHPRWKMQIMMALRRVLPKAMIIATTHDPLCLRGMHDQEVVVFNKTVRHAADFPGALPITVEAFMDLPNVENLTVEQLLTSDFFSMFSTDSPTVELHLAKLGDLLARQAESTSLTIAESLALDNLKNEIADALPLGSSEVQRLVQDAVFIYLKNRRGADADRLSKLKAKTRNSIIGALGGY